MIKYAKIKLYNQRTFFLEIESENDSIIIGTEIKKDGEAITPRGYDGRTRIIQKTTIQKITQMKMNLHYGELEPIQ